ncbi:hypothetical protein [Dysgonomonas sp. 511]|uniref:Cbp1 family collagen-binding glycoprotein adhesin n=1 Tax=Dysgonomonas sp. 511 TaxID=2302930 RepID=UPI0013D0918D|nr:hypothetical protein [Dysgonomonas sp. 511]NDV79356.1 hypothetical protein [Dysgonomonas sp. 511]
MKKMLVGCLCLLALASCNVKNSDEYKRLQAERDSLMQANAQSNNELSETTDLINEIEENFRQIRETEKWLAIESKGKGELSVDKKTEIKENFEMLNEILKKNKENIEKLNRQLKSNSGQMATFKKTIENLNAELTERAKTISELQQSLATRDEQIAALKTDVQSLAANVDELATQTAEQASKIKAQDQELHTAYYMFGTSKELKEAKVVTGGFLASNKILNEGIEASKFIQVDIRKTLEIPLYDKKAKVLSDHPKDSYTLEKDANGKMVLKVSDYKKFWSLTKFLVVQVG